MARLLWLLPLLAGIAAFALVSEGSAGNGRTHSASSGAMGVPVAKPAMTWLSNDPRHHTGDTGIVMIAADWCGYCRRLRQQLDAAKVPYRVLDVDTPAGKRALVATGARAVPVTLIGQYMVQGYDTAALDERLVPLGYRVF